MICFWYILMRCAFAFKATKATTISTGEMRENLVHQLFLWGQTKSLLPGPLHAILIKVLRFAQWRLCKFSFVDSCWFLLCCCTNLECRSLLQLADRRLDLWRSACGKSFMTRGGDRVHEERCSMHQTCHFLQKEARILLRHELRTSLHDFSSTPTAIQAQVWKLCKIIPPSMHPIWNTKFGVQSTGAFAMISTPCPGEPYKIWLGAWSRHVGGWPMLKAKSSLKLAMKTLPRFRCVHL